MSTNQKLRDIADKLPKVMKFAKGKPCFTFQKELISGEEIIEKYPEVNEINGVPIIPTKIYSKIKRIPIYVNHFKELQKVNKKERSFGVMNYIKKYVPDFDPANFKPEKV